MGGARPYESCRGVRQQMAVRFISWQLIGSSFSQLGPPPQKDKPNLVTSVAGPQSMGLYGTSGEEPIWAERCGRSVCKSPECRLI